MAKITISEAVHVDIRIDNETVTVNFGPGDVEALDAIADLLIAQGIAKPAVDAPAKTSKKSEPTPKENSEA